VAKTAHQSTKNTGFYQLTKRILDICFAASTLVLVSPFILFGVLAIKLTNPGPVFYRAKRAGLGGKPFDMYKLRTMYVGSDALDRKITQFEDDRITPVGKLLRKLKVDELPQFWNVLRGDMSVVGPRPEDFEIVEKYYTSSQQAVLETRPGIACPVDVQWYPDLAYHDPPPPGVTMQEWYLERHLPVQVAAGISYVEQQNLILDLKVIGQTFCCVIFYSWLTPKRKTLSASGYHKSDI
jgi:lipopolysaccharide/colanic/teichoic acid biosynthesis glycosyltransferase